MTSSPLNIAILWVKFFAAELKRLFYGFILRNGLLMVYLGLFFTLVSLKIMLDGACAGFGGR